MIVCYLFVQKQLVIVFPISARSIELFDKPPTEILGIVAFFTPADCTRLLVLSLVVSEDV